MQNNIVESAAAAAAEPQSLDTILNQGTPLEFVTILHNEFDELFQNARDLSETSGINQTLLDNLESASQAVSQVIGEVLKTQESTKEYQAIANQAIQAIEALRQEFSKNTPDVSKPTDYITPFTDLQEIITENQNLASSLSIQFSNPRLPKSIPQREIDIALDWTQQALGFTSDASALVEKGLLLAAEIPKKNKIVEQCYDKKIILQVSSELAKNKHTLAQIQVGNAKTQAKDEEACAYASASQLYDFAVNKSRQAQAEYNQAEKNYEQAFAEYNQAIDKCRTTYNHANLNTYKAEQAIQQAQKAIEQQKIEQAELESKNNRGEHKNSDPLPQNRHEDNPSHLHEERIDTTQKIEDQKQSSWSTNNKILVGGSIGFFAGAGLGVGFSLGVNGFQEAILGLFINNVQECISNHPVVSIVMVSAICAVLALILASIITKLIDHYFNKSSSENRSLDNSRH